MAWQLNSTNTRILVGPIVRKVTDKFFSVFIITKDESKAQLIVYTNPNDLRDSHSQLASDYFAPKKLKDGTTYANLIYIEIAEPLNELLFCYYNIVFDDNKELRDGGILTSNGDIQQYCLNEHPLPSFVIPPADPEKLQLMHSSCRKLHGDFIDAFIQAGKLLDENATIEDVFASPNRPQILCLTGDQIYADDVSDTVLFMIKQVNQTYYNYLTETDTEIIELTKIGGQTIFTEADLQQGKRVDIIGSKKQNNTNIIYGAKLTAGKVSGSHLIKMGEFFSMYMLAWSDVFWYDSKGDFSFPAFSEVYPGINEERTIIKALGETITIRTPEKKQYDNDIKNLKGNDFKSVRKILANISTMMLFDDHEVTDDLFIDKIWVENSIGSNANPLAKKIVSSGLIAYTVFQDWGNKPQDYESGIGLDLLNNITNLSSQIDYVLPDVETIGSGPGIILSTDDSSKLKFHYKYFPNSNNLYEIVALNCRTNREFANSSAIPKLISKSALTPQITDDYCSTLKLSILLAPTPVFGYEKVENIQIMASASRSMRLDNDNEAWGLNQQGREEFLASLYQRKHPVSSGTKDHKIVLLSGDVHYGFAKRIEYKGEQSLSTPDSFNLKMVIANFCASSLKNETKKTISLNEWKNDKDIEFKGRVDSSNNLKPAFGTMVFDYKYNVKQISKSNAFEDNPSFPTDSTEQDIINIIKKHKDIEGLSEVNIGFNNIGLISFKGSEGNLQVKQTLYWPGASKPIASTSSVPFKSSAYILDFSINF